MSNEGLNALALKEQESHDVQPRHSKIPFADRWFKFIIRATPLLWLSGLLALVTPFVIVVSFARRKFCRHISDPAICGWLLIAGMQAISTVINWAQAGEEPSVLLYRFLSAPVSGWVFIAALLAIGKEMGRSARDLNRSVGILGIYVLCLGPALLCAGTLLGITDFEFLTPMGHLIPSNLPSAQFEFTAQFFIPDDFVGKTQPRVVLFYPWPTCLGFAGAAIVFISLSLRRSAFKVFAILGGAFGVVASTSRAASLGTLVAFCLFSLVRLPTRKKAFALPGAALLCLLLLFLPAIFNINMSDVVTESQHAISSLREDSSSGRKALYKETVNRVSEAPVIGHGWQGEILEDTIPLNIGSHSTFYGLLYTGGILTFAPFLFTSLVVLHRLLTNAPGRPQAETAFCIFVVLIIMSYGECIYSFAIPVFFAFLWIGTGLDARTTERSSEA